MTIYRFSSLKCLLIPFLRICSSGILELRFPGNFAQKVYSYAVINTSYLHISDTYLWTLVQYYEWKFLFQIIIKCFFVHFPSLVQILISSISIIPGIKWIRSKCLLSIWIDNYWADYFVQKHLREMWNQELFKFFSVTIFLWSRSCVPLGKLIIRVMKKQSRNQR